MSKIMIDEINNVINTKIKPLLAEHNGDIELVEVNNGVAYVKLLGACSGCPSARFTMEELISCVLKEIPEIKDVQLVDPISREMLDFARQLLRK
ncbi:NifU family protein [Clostridium beijerinckii]|jgi:Thioredoxin-like proteins and domains|uniref:NifU family protein n=3 Tax=Clostridium beijerinckii TaxID=1520 RepID=A0AAE2V2I3_CLOBE|nr:NifU family protein [Clostridium beijerinckii]ABR34268.1 nitrogen-fixing NifU domain protein [Clostridium beijerinckii NCIMB 8052]AIU02896.1 NifU domain-containing protein [Clostridium beijerinckii ATCC 35702]MBF7811122.1 NifU family protein [Clostridium beijerinckii]NRT67986.1 Fe-S cluster biogenesis protein NfuA [Clostridium beijerinckii]NRU47562.1 Fe-S cluster biogenesis protein NfuA [Clostridium beijerinckii]